MSSKWLGGYFYLCVVLSYSGCWAGSAARGAGLLRLRDGSCHHVLWADGQPALTAAIATTTFTATRAQNIVELYGMLPVVADNVDLNPFPSKASVAASGRELACPMDRMGRA